MPEPIYTRGSADDGASLKTLDDGKPPKTRIGTGDEAYQIWTNLWQADTDRSKRRTLAKGLVDGNPPFAPADLAAAGQSYRCNVNFGQARSYLENASGALYDLFNEAPTYATVMSNKGTEDDQIKYSRSITEHFDWLMRYEPRFDYNMQVSQNETIMYSTGPMAFNDELDWVPRAVLAGSMKVPEGAKSDTNYWELCTVEVEYNADELWRKIVNEGAAKTAGWNVSAVKQAIMNASPYYAQGGLYRNWEWHQQQLKNGSFYYSDTSKVIGVVHIFFQEFSEDGNQAGKISQVTINRDQAAQNGGNVFLYQKIGRYDSWNQCIHPMYYDRGGGGFHHSVTGLGVKMYPALAFINRLRCANADKAFAPKVAFKPSTATNADEFSLEVHGDYMILNEGYEPVQMPVGSYLEDGVAFDRFIGNELNANLGQYRQSKMKEGGNPVTAEQVKYEASNEARLAKTQLNRYYTQLDGLYAEMFRRAVYMGKKKVGYGYKRCEEFIERCKKDGVPLECLDVEHIEHVKATRVIGQGSEFMRQQSLEFLLSSVFPMLPETGRFHMVQDVIASRAGQSAVNRYAPEQTNQLPDNQYAWAMSQVADMKTGVPAVVTESQQSLVFATVFIDACAKAIESLQQGANPAEVVAFLELAGQAIAQHIQRLSIDPTRKDIVKDLNAKLKEIGQVTDQLTEQLQKQAQEQQEQQAALQQQAQEQNGELALKKQAQDFKLMLSQQKTQFGLREKAMKSAQGMAITDATAAEKLRIQAQQHNLDIQQQEEQHRADLNGADKSE